MKYSSYFSFRRTASSLTLRAGSTIKDKGGKYLFIEKIFQHPDFSMTTIDNDVSVLKLRYPAKFSDAIQPIKLPDPNVNIDHKTAICTGWGRMSADGDKATILQAVELEVFPDQECKNIYEDKLTGHMICAGDMSGAKDACIVSS